MNNPTTMIPLAAAASEAVDLLTLTAACLLGIVMGGSYFGGLWWTVQRMRRSPRPIRFYLFSMIVRSALSVAVLWLALTRFGWPGLVASLIGFLAARWVTVRTFGGTLPADPTHRDAA